MSKNMIKIVNCTTGEELERTLTLEEIEANKIAEQIRVNKEIELAELNAPKLAAKVAAEGKLAALGLTTDDLRALGL